MIERERIILEARSWKGTPFRHQGRIKGMACDCAGLVIGVARELDLPYRDVLDYGRQPHLKRMRTALDEQMDRIAIGSAKPGDVIWITWQRYPQHLAILTDIGMIHAYESAGEVVEHPMNNGWRSLIRAAYSYRS
jgi:NlpC/P60 family putative phage cell wall peptidase